MRVDACGVCVCVAVVRLRNTDTAGEGAADRVGDGGGAQRLVELDPPFSRLSSLVLCASTLFNSLVYPTLLHCLQTLTVVCGQASVGVSSLRLQDAHEALPHGPSLLHPVAPRSGLTPCSTRRRRPDHPTALTVWNDGSAWANEAVSAVWMSVSPASPTSPDPGPNPERHSPTHSPAHHANRSRAARLQAAIGWHRIISLNSTCGEHHTRAPSQGTSKRSPSRSPD